ncbi:VOC family protein [Nocardia sp. ET3-3]|uniref:VOC family protein n=1 Tax=Nocardia terrae TaxID=2675851 RepID=A0A7K1VAP0_9NOCA|nr:VOC family protein [Nocardia terrae]MVU83561.1 VOC family protein [Nocardia terrae]
MSTPPFNTVAWFQVGSDEPERVKEFYGSLFGWNFAADPDEDGTYDLVTYPGSDMPAGGIAHTDDPSGNHAIFYVLVADVPAVLAAAEQAGGKVDQQPVTAKNGLVFAKILDTSGNAFGVFSPPPAN